MKECKVKTLHGYDDRPEYSIDAVRRTLIKEVNKIEDGVYELVLDTNLSNPLNNPLAITDIEFTVDLIEDLTLNE